MIRLKNGAKLERIDDPEVAKRFGVDSNDWLITSDDGMLEFTYHGDLTEESVLEDFKADCEEQSAYDIIEQYMETIVA